ncbi:MAG TPA: hypothetical protein VNR87_10390 [Flavisolibacter sp.]|nr:hypothetical protein [Flavisolibacter sp.]
MKRLNLFSAKGNPMFIKFKISALKSIWVFLVLASVTVQAQNRSDTKLSAGAGTTTSMNKSSSNPVYLDSLYFTGGELNNLLKNPGRKAKKLVLDDFRKANGSLTLLAWSAKKKNKKFEQDYVVELQALGHTDIDISSIDLVLGNQEITKEKTKALRKLAKEKDIESIILVPQKENSGNHVRLRYEIIAAAKKSKGQLGAMALDISTLELTSIGLTNPSPPYGSNAN